MLIHLIRARMQRNMQAYTKIARSTVCRMYTLELCASNEKWWIAVWMARQCDQSTDIETVIEMLLLVQQRGTPHSCDSQCWLMEKLFKSNFHFNLNVTYTRSSAYPHQRPHTEWVNRINHSESAWKPCITVLPLIPMCRKHSRGKGTLVGTCFRTKVERCIFVELITV